MIAITQTPVQTQQFPRAVNGIAIDDFSADRFAIKVNWRARSKRDPQTTEICKPYYELWLQYTGRLDWCIQRRGDDTPQNIIGTMAAEDYWENAEYQVKINDLISYILKEVLAQRALS
jgi:hypothetical protein